MLMSIEFYVVAFGYSYVLLQTYDKYKDKLSSNIKEILGLSGLIFGAYCTLVGYLLFIDILQIYGDRRSEIFEQAAGNPRVLIFAIVVPLLTLVMMVIGLGCIGLSFSVGRESTRKWVQLTYCVTLSCCAGTTLFFDSLYLTDTRLLAREQEAANKERLFNYQKCISDTNNSYDKTSEIAKNEAMDSTKLAYDKHFKMSELDSKIDDWLKAEKMELNRNYILNSRLIDIDAIFQDRIDKARMLRDVSADSCRRKYGASN